MGYYDDDEDELYFDYEESIEPVGFVADSCTEEDITAALFETGLVNEKMPRLLCSMEKLIFVHGDSHEVYSPAEIQFIEQVGQVCTYSDFYKSLNGGNMACRVFATKFCCDGNDALKMCVSFEKIIDKAFDGFNIFFLVVNDAVYLGCRIFGNNGKDDCALSYPIYDETIFEQMQEEICFYASNEKFSEFYNLFKNTISCDAVKKEDLEEQIIKKRGIQYRYLDDIDSLGEQLGVNMSKEIERYYHQFEDHNEISFANNLEEVFESLSFIKSNRVNTYEMLFEADEMVHKAEEVETENDRLAIQSASELSSRDMGHDNEMKTLLENPEYMIKLLKKRRGI